MGAARTVTAATIIDSVEYELRDSGNTQFTEPELLVYLNRCLELIYEILVETNSELIATGSGSITLASATETYDLPTNSMGDFWCPYKLEADSEGELLCAIYLTDADGTTYPPLELIEQDERYYYVELGSSSHDRPTSFYLFGDNMGFLPPPDGVYTATIDRYFPNFVPLSASSANMPYKNLFNLQIEEGIKLLCKNRQDRNVGIEGALMDIFQKRALSLMYRRRKKTAFLKISK